MKKLLALMFLMLLPIAAWAGTYYDPQTNVIYGYDTSSGTAYVSINSGASGDITILSSFTVGGKDYSVTSIGASAFSGCSGLTSVTIPSSVKNIGDYAFRNCSGLTSITIPNSVESIGDYAFLGCSGLTSITIPNSVTSIGNYAFHNCRGLTAITIPNSVTSIGQSAFENCSGLTSITIPNSVTSIGREAFYSCSGLTAITIPNSVTSIGEMAFYYCSGLTSIYVDSGNTVYDSRNNCNAIIVTGTNKLIAGCQNTIIPNSVTSIGEEAFAGCSGLTSITIPNSVTSIGEEAFGGCSGLTAVTIPNSVTSIRGWAFADCSGLTAVTFPNSVTSISDAAFYGCSGLTSVTIPNSVTSIGGSAFYGCSGLTSVTIPNSVTSIEGYTFSGCSSLTSITIPNSVTSIGAYTLSDCSSLTSFTIPESVSSIGDGAFQGCNSLTSVNIPNSVTSIGNYAFRDCSVLTSITIPNSVTSIGNGAFNGCSSLTSVTINCQNVGSWFSNKQSIQEVVLRDGVTSIGNGAFNGCSSLSSVTIPNSVTSIEDWAFYGCSGLSSVTIPSSVTSIGEGAFSYLGTLTMLADTPPVLAATWAIGSEIVVCVPSGALTAYRTADKWSEFANRICTKADYDVTVHVDDSRSSLHEIIGEENLQNVVSLKITGGINSYDIMVMRNKMDNLHFLDLTDANIVASSYEYVTGKHTEDNVLAGFNGLSKLRSVKLPKSIVRIGDSAFSGCNNLQEVEFQEGIEKIGSSAFRYCNSLRAINLKAGLKTIGDNAFENYSTSSGPYVEELIIPEGVTSIGGYAFANNKNLKHVALPSTLKTIGQSVFSYCSNLQSISLPTSLESIPGSVFKNCSSLTRVDIPSTITSIGNEAFGGCSNLTDVYTYIVEPTPIDMNTFSTYTTATLHVPSTSYYNYWYDTEWSQFRKLEEFLAEYQYFYLNGDFTIDDDKGTINGSIDDDDPNADLNPGSGLIVETDEDNPQLLNIVHIKAKGAISASIIAASNMEANKVYFDIEITAGRWYFLSFPFNVKAANITAPGVYTFRSYNAEERANGKVGWQNWIGDLLEKGQGYIFQCAKGGTLSLCVEKDDMDWDAENRPQTLTAAPSADKQDASWNFIGNPQTSYFDIDETGYEQPITVWNGSGYDAVRAGDDTYALSPFEAFFVQKPDNQSAMEFPADGRYTMKQWEEAQTAKAAARRQAGVDANRLMVNIRISDGQTTDKTRVVFNQQKSKDYEMDCDAAKFMSTEQVPQLYSLDGRQARYAINERPLGEVPLGYKAVTGGELTISAMRMDQPVRLRDTKLQITHDLSMGDYTFSTDAGTFDDRFVLTIDNSTTSIGTMKEQTGVSVMAEEGGIAFTGIGSAPADVYTVGGTLIAGQVGNGFLSLPKATYVVKVGTVTTKVMVR